MSGKSLSIHKLENLTTVVLTLEVADMGLGVCLSDEVTSPNFTLLYGKSGMWSSSSSLSS